MRGVFGVPEIVGLRGEDLTAKGLAQEIGTMLNVLTEEGCIEGIPRYAGYEFAENLCGVAGPAGSNGGKVEGAVGLMTTARRVREEGRRLVEMVRWAAAEAFVLLADVDYEGRNECPS